MKGLVSTRTRSSQRGLEVLRTMWSCVEDGIEEESMTDDGIWQARWTAVYGAFVAARCAEMSLGHLEWTPEPGLMAIIVRQARRVADEQQRQFEILAKGY